MAIAEEYMTSEEIVKTPGIGSVSPMDFSKQAEELAAEIEGVVPTGQQMAKSDVVKSIVASAEYDKRRELGLLEKLDLFRGDDDLLKVAEGMYSTSRFDVGAARDASGKGAVNQTIGDPSDDPLRPSMSPRYASAPARPLSLEENIDIVKKRMATEVGSAEGDVATSEGKMKDAERKFAELSEDIKTFKVNPFRLYENTLFAVTAALAAGLGAAAQSLSGGGPNTGLAMVNRAIEMDVLRQKHEYGALKDSAAKQATLYGQAIQLYGSDKKAVAALKAAGADMASKKATLDMHKYGIEVNQQKYVNDVLAQNFRTLMSSLAGVGGKGAKVDEQEEVGKRAMASAAEGFKGIIEGYRKLNREGGWVKTNMVAFMSKYAPNLLATLSDDPTVQDIVADRENTKKVMNSLVRAALVAGGEGGKISDVDVELTTKEIMGLIPQGSLLFPEQQLNVLENAVNSWVKTKTGLTAEEALKNYGEGRAGVRNQAQELAEYVVLEKAKSDEEEKSKNASRMGAAGQWGWGSRR